MPLKIGVPREVFPGEKRVATVPEVVEKRMTPLEVTVSEPLMLQYLTVLLLASLINRMVEVPAVLEVLVLVMMRSLADPVVFTLPSMVT